MVRQEFDAVDNKSQSQDEERSSKKQKRSLADFVDLVRVSDYGDFTLQTAIFNKVSVPRNLSYLYCGVVEEFCEFRCALRKLKVSLDSGSDDVSEHRLSVLKELGDVTWYLSAMCNELELDLASVANVPEDVPELDIRKPSLSDLEGLDTVLSQMLDSIGTIGGKVKKSIRDHDDNGIVSEEKRGVIVQSIQELFTALADDVTVRMGSCLVDVMRINVQKMVSRFARGVVKGDGDNR